jgi:hypothetical protein
MKFLLYLKPWKLFLLFFLCVIFSANHYTGLGVCVLFWIVYTAWVYNIGTAMHKLIPLNTKPGIKYFKFNCLYIQFVLIAIVVFAIAEMLLGLHLPTMPYSVQSIIKIILLLYLIWSWVYFSMFAARMLESVIEGELVNKSDSLKGFFCLLFFPIGVWYIQPAVQRVLIKYKGSGIPLRADKFLNII